MRPYIQFWPYHYSTLLIQWPIAWAAAAGAAANETVSRIIVRFLQLSNSSPAVWADIMCYLLVLRRESTHHFIAEIVQHLPLSNLPHSVRPLMREQCHHFIS